MLRVKLNIKGSTTPEQFSKLTRARELFEKAVNSREFKTEVVGYSYDEWSSTGRLWWRKWTKRKVAGFRECSESGQQVYDKIMTGGEDLSPEVDHEADIEVKVEVGSRGVIGWTNPHTPIQWISSWFINSRDVVPAEIAGNLSHEWMHKMGYDHAFRYYDGREDTVPYAIGEIISKLAQDIEKGIKLTPNE